MHKGNYKADQIKHNLRNILVIFLLDRETDYSNQKQNTKHQGMRQSDFMITLLIRNMFFFQITQVTQVRNYDSFKAMRK